MRGSFAHGYSLARLSRSPSHWMNDRVRLLYGIRAFQFLSALSSLSTLPLFKILSSQFRNQDKKPQESLKLLKMPSPFHQKYSSQRHRVYSKKAIHSNKSAAATTEEHGSSTSSPPASTTARRMSTGGSKFANLEALKRPQTEEGIKRRLSAQESKIGTPGVVGSLWNNYTRGSTTIQPAPKKESRDTTTLKQ